MPSLHRNVPESSKHASIPSPSPTPGHRYSSATLAASSSLASPPRSIPDIHVERSRSRASGSRGGALAGEDYTEDSPPGASRFTAGNLSGSYGKSNGPRSRRSGGGFLLEMSRRYGVDELLSSSGREGIRSASDPIARPPNDSSSTEGYTQLKPAPPSSRSRRSFLDQRQKFEPGSGSTSKSKEKRPATESSGDHLEEIFTNEADTAKIVSMAFMSKDRKSMHGGRWHALKESIDPYLGRRSSSGGRDNFWRPLRTAALPQNAPSDKWPSKGESQIQSVPEPAVQGIDPRMVEQQRRQSVHPFTSFPLHPSQPRALPFDQALKYPVKINPSKSTLARVEKARQYIELYAQYRDFLLSLPPATEIPTVMLSQQQSLHHYHGHNSNQQLNPSQHPLRRYNPLQTIRNRRLRNRQGLGQLNLSPWEDPNAIRSWITESQESYKSLETQKATSPPNSLTPLTKQIHLPPPPRLQDADKVRNKPKRPRIDWVVHPSEMFADFYWMNEENGKAIMEDRFANKVFPKEAMSTGGSPARKVEKDPASTPSSFGARGSMERARMPGRGKVYDTPPRWSLEYGDQQLYNASRRGSSSHVGDHDVEPSGGDIGEQKILASRASKTDEGGSNISDMEENGAVFADVGKSYDMQSNANSDEGAGVILPPRPGITIGIGGGCTSPDDSPYEDQSEIEETKRARASIDSKRYSSQFEDDMIPASLGVRRAFVDSVNKVNAEKSGTKRKHHLSSHFTSHLRHKKADDEHLSTASSTEPSYSESSDSSGSEGKRKHMRWRRHRRKQAHTIFPAEDDLSGDEGELTAEGEELGGLEKRHSSRHNPLLALPKRLKQKVRREKQPNPQLDDSDDDAHYESAHGISRSPSPGVARIQEAAARTSLDSEPRVVDFAHSPPPEMRSTLAPPVTYKSMRHADTSPFRGGEHQGYSRSPSPAVTSIGESNERGREQKDSKSKDDVLGMFIKRKASPTKKKLSGRRSEEYYYDDEAGKDATDSARNSKDLERYGAILPDKEKDKEKKSKAKYTVRKAKEKVGHRVERIKNGVGDLVWGKETTQSVPSSNYASSMGSAGGTSGPENDTEDEKEKPKKANRLSLDFETMFKGQKRGSRPGHMKRLSTSALHYHDLDSARLETNTASDASADVDWENVTDHWGRTANDKRRENLQRLEIPQLKVMGPSRESSPALRRGNSTGLPETTSYDKLRPGGVKIRRERSRLAEEIRGDSESPAETNQPLPALGRLRLSPVHPSARQGANTGTSTRKQRSRSKKELAHAKALLLSAGILARGWPRKLSISKESKPLTLTTFNAALSLPARSKSPLTIIPSPPSTFPHKSTLEPMTSKPRDFGDTEGDIRDSDTAGTANGRRGGCIEWRAEHEICVGSEEVER
ncbi:hypothetical protein BDZ91DRAFT_778698 [Kalaharituber pfeilii]|nr:hypothetical protein BDZ91DRAFT_778698 [Kalaharituber pfeilii]